MRPRTRANRILPANLYRKTVKGKSYYQYRHPQTKSYHAMGSDLNLAMQAANELNARLSFSPSVQALVTRVEAPRTTVRAYITHYQTVVLAKRVSRRGVPLAQKTIREYETQLKHVDEGLGSLGVEAVTRRHVSTFLDAYPDVMRNRYRSLLHGMFSHAVAEGHREDNPVSGTLKKTEVKKRERLTIGTYLNMHGRAPFWMQHVMTWALRTCQRREDLSALNYADINDGHWYCIQQKTGAKLKIKLRDDLLEMLRRGDHGPVFVYSWRACKVKAVTAEMMTREFARLRPEGCTATFHEIRALGAEILRQNGTDPQALLGHVDAAMTRRYLDGHKKEWVEVGT